MLRKSIWKLTALAIMLGGVGIYATPPAFGQATAVAQELPAAKDIIDNYIKAIGGKDAISKVKSLTGKGKLEIPVANMSGDVEMFQSDGKMLMVIELPGFGKQTVGFDGTVAWQDSDLTGPQLLEGGMLEDMKFQAKIDGYSDAAEHFDSLATLTLADFNGESAYKVVAKKKGTPDKTLYFAKESGLLIGSEGKQETPFGEITATTFTKDYKKVGGLLISHTAEIKMSNGIDQSITMTEIQVNSEIPQGKFDLPESVKRLVK